MKKYSKIIIGVGVLLLIIGIAIVACTYGNKDSRRFKKEYESINNKDNGKGKKYRKLSIPANNPFIYATTKDIVEKVENKETFVVYFGFKECPWCRSVVEELIKAAKDKGVNTIYYVDVKDIRNEKTIDENGVISTTKKGDKDYLTLLKEFHDVLSDYILYMGDEKVYDGEKRIYAPNVIVVSKGKAIQMETGTPENLKDPYGKLTKEMKSYTYNKFKCLLECLEEEKNTCKKDMC